MLANLSEIKKEYLEFEQNYLSEFAAKSSESKGREIQDESCPLRTEFQRDRDKILHSKAFRRLKHKTQVFISPVGDHYRTRMTHALEVAQISRTISRALRLNEDLTEAIALGHDLGHTPFGHSGESALDELLENGFSHNEQSVRVVKVLEPQNLTYETIDGILNHRLRCKPKTLEAQVVQLSDKIAYLNHDIDDAFTAGIIKSSDIPEETEKYFGKTKRSRINYMITDIVANSKDKPEVKPSAECKEQMKILRTWMFKNVYNNRTVKKEEKKVKNMIKNLFEYYMENHELLQNQPEYNIQPKEIIVADYIACMTDKFALQKFKNLFVPSSWEGSSLLSG